VGFGAGLLLGHRWPLLDSELEAQMQQSEAQSFLCQDLLAWRCYRQLHREEGRILGNLAQLGYEDRPDFDLHRFVEVVLEAEKRYGVPHEILIGVAIIESQFNPQALSSKGARGLYQILPSTARLLWPGFVKTLSPKDRLLGMNPDKDYANLRLATLLGAYYLSQLRDAFSGKMHLALASYNVGPGTLKKGLDEGRMPGAEYVFRVFDLVNILKGRDQSYARLAN
jgi:membrane-bound lytic murein transglycosylase MltF